MSYSTIEILGPLIFSLFISICVYIDAKRIRRINTNLDLNVELSENDPGPSPVNWALGILFLMIVFLPLYLFKRPGFLRTNGHKPNKVPSIAVGALIVAIITLSAFPSLLEMRMSTSELEAEVWQDIINEYAADSETKDYKIKSVWLVHKSGNEYVGRIVAIIDNEEEAGDVFVTYDGEQYLWEVKFD